MIEKLVKLIKLPEEVLELYFFIPGVKEVVNCNLKNLEKLQITIISIDVQNKAIQYLKGVEIGFLETLDIFPRNKLTFLHKIMSKHSGIQKGIELYMAEIMHRESGVNQDIANIISKTNCGFDFYCTIIEGLDNECFTSEPRTYLNDLLLEYLDLIISYNPLLLMNYKKSDLEYLICECAKYPKLQDIIRDWCEMRLN